MIHWLTTVVQTYLLHFEHGNGYQFWSGAGSDIGEATIVLAIWHQVNCAEPGCWWPGHRGRDHRCGKHYRQLHDHVR